jgi:predicted ABC-type ATPase
LKKIIIIAGPNGAGKTTFARDFLPAEAQTACADRDLTSLWAQCRSCCDQTVHWARAGQTEIGGLDQMVIGVNTQDASFFRRFTSGQAVCPWSPFQGCSAA